MSDVHLLVLDHQDPDRAHRALRGHILKYGGLEVEALRGWNRQAMHELTSNGGFTMHDHVDNAPKSGYMVSVDPEREEVHDLAHITPKHIADYSDRNKKTLRDPNTYMGGWVHQGKVYLDTAKHFTDASEAMKAAKEHKQLAIYDLGSGKSIDVKHDDDVQHPRAAQLLVSRKDEAPEDFLARLRQQGYTDIHGSSLYEGDAIRRQALRLVPPRDDG